MLLASLTFLQVVGDFTCCILSIICAYKNDKKYRLFFILNLIAFLGICIGDIYYNYYFRYLKLNIADSLNIVITLSMLSFQLSQIYNWCAIIKIHKIDIFNFDNVSYLFFSLALFVLLTYYFINSNMMIAGTWYQIINVFLNMFVWILAIICLSRSRTLGFTLLTLGCLLITSAALTTDCLFMLAMDKLASAESIHIIWVIGVLIMAYGFYTSIRQEFEFCPPNSIQTKCCFWISITSLFLTMLILLLLQFFDKDISLSISSQLWGMPIILAFSMILSVLSGNWFANIILFPVNKFMNAIQFFDIGKLSDHKDQISNQSYHLYEFNVLNSFINKAFMNMTNQLQREIKLSAQIAHDLRSPLTALESIIRRLLIEDENKKILLRDTVNHIRDITNNLEKNNLANQKSGKLLNTQIATLLEYVISEKKAAYSNQHIDIASEFDISSYSLFVEIIPSEMKRILANIINNACEAVAELTKPIINVSLSLENSQTIITISDNGTGISNENLSKIFKQGFTTKNNGSGLGLYHAKENLMQWYGDIELISKYGRGCSAKIKLPSKKMPLWFISKLTFTKNSTVVSVEDSISIWQAWQDRFSSINANIQLNYCSSKDELINFLNNDNSSMCNFLIDYEFSGKSYTGLDLADIIMSQKLSNFRIFLVTSHSNEEIIQKICIEKEIYLIPKSYALKMPINIITPEKIKKIIFTNLQVPVWINEHNNIAENTLFYNEENNLLADISLFDKTSHIFIQSDLLNDALKNNLETHGFNILSFKNLSTII